MVPPDSKNVAPSAVARPALSAANVFATVKRLGPAGPLALMAATLPAIGGLTVLFTLNVVGPWLKDHHELGVLIYIALFALLAGFAILPTYAQSLLGGWAFGFAVGYPAAVGGVLGGALIGYSVGLRATGDRVVRILAEHPKWNAVYRALLGSGFWKTLLIVTLLRIPPSSPFAITNLVLAATRVPPLPYIVGTILGLAPRAAAVVLVGAGLKELTFEQTQQKWFWIAGIVAAIIVVAIIGYMANRAIAAVTDQPNAARPSRAGQSPAAGS